MVRRSIESAKPFAHLQDMNADRRIAQMGEEGVCPVFLFQITQAIADPVVGLTPGDPFPYPVLFTHGIGDPFRRIEDICQGLGLDTNRMGRMLFHTQNLGKFPILHMGIDPAEVLAHMADGLYNLGGLLGH